MNKLKSKHQNIPILLGRGEVKVQNNLKHILITPLWDKFEEVRKDKNLALIQKSDTPDKYDFYGLLKEANDRVIPSFSLFDQVIPSPLVVTLDEIKTQIQHLSLTEVDKLNELDRQTYITDYFYMMLLILIYLARNKNPTLFIHWLNDFDEKFNVAKRILLFVQTMEKDFLPSEVKI